MMQPLAVGQSAFLLAQEAAAHEKAIMDPLWLVLLIIAAGPFAFLIVHAVVSFLAGWEYRFPVTINRLGPKFCPHCGKAISPPAEHASRPAA